MVTKFCVLTTCIMSAAIAIGQVKPFMINGKMSGKTDTYIYLTYEDQKTNANIMDSALITNGHFTFKGQLSGPAQAVAMMDKRGSNGKYVYLYIVPGDMELSLAYDNFRDGAILKGSPVQAEADVLERSKAQVMKELDPLSKAYETANEVYSKAVREKKDEATLKQLKEEAEKAKNVLEPYLNQLRAKQIEFMDKNPSSYVTASLLRYHISSMPVKEGEERYGKLTDDIKNSSLGKSLKKELDGLLMGSPGAKAYVFASKELRGEPLSLADYKGKYVLLDFWASWCVPCRKGNPHLLSLYSKYRQKGFEIIGISDDDGRPDAWAKAVEQDKINVWKHILRGYDAEKRMKGEKNESDISEYYGIHSLPTKILIDPNGTIIGRYGGGGEDDEAMDKKLSEIFGN